MQAAKALNTVDVFFILEKGAAKDGMMELRREICRRYATDRAYRVVEAPSPPREPRPADYAACVDDLNRAKQEAFERMIADGLGEGQTAILGLGRPSLYDSTIRNVEAIAARQVSPTRSFPASPPCRFDGAIGSTSTRSAGRSRSRPAVGSPKAGPQASIPSW